MKNLKFLGMLWRIDNPKNTPLDKALNIAVKYYKKKYGNVNICTMNNKMIDHFPESIIIDNDEINIYEDNMVQDNHFVVGFDNGADN